MAFRFALLGFLFVLPLLVRPAAVWAGPSDATPPPTLAELELQLLDLTNTDRTRSGLAPVEPDATMLEVARARAAAQLVTNGLSHYDPDGTIAMVSLLAEAGVSYQLAGENLARDAGLYGGIAETVEGALLQSPAHRRNILHPAFTRVAIGAAVDPAGRVALAEIFRAL